MKRPKDGFCLLSRFYRFNRYSFANQPLYNVKTKLQSLVWWLCNGSDIITRFAGDTSINLLESPFYSTEFKTKENLTFSSSYAKFGTTLYVERYGRTPNDLSQQDAVLGYGVPGGGRLATWTTSRI